MDMKFSETIINTGQHYDTNMESSMTIVAKNGSAKIGGQYMNEMEYCFMNRKAFLYTNDFKTNGTILNN